jgi:hypothetical protein
LTKTRHPDLDQEEHPDLDQEHPDLNQQIAQTQHEAHWSSTRGPDIFADPTTTQQPWMLCRQAMHHGEQKSDITAARQ